MDSTPTHEQRQIREMVADFVDEEVAPEPGDIDETDEFPADIVDPLGGSFAIKALTDELEAEIIR